MLRRALASAALLAAADFAPAADLAPAPRATTVATTAVAADPPATLPPIPTIPAPPKSLVPGAKPTAPVAVPMYVPRAKVATTPTSLPPVLIPVDCGPNGCTTGCPRGPIFWGSADNLFFFLKDPSLPVPLATTGPVAGRGVLGNPLGPGVVILGNTKADYRGFNGMLFTLGGWVNEQRDLGIEGSMFLLENRALRTTLTGGPNGLPVLARPFFDTTTQTPNARLIASPGRFEGSIATQNTMRLWGAEIDGLGRLIENEAWSLDAIAGFRFMSLEESLRIDDAVSVLPGGITTFNGVGTLPPASTAVSDYFSTQNRFYGGTIGARANAISGKWYGSVTGKISLGSMHEVVNVNGTSTLFGGGNPLPATVPGGLYNLATNSGRFSRDTFAAVPEIGMKVGYQISSHVGVTASYNFLYLSRVVRPGDQVNQAINTTILPTSPTLGVPFGPRQPSFPFTESDFWAHGISFGFDFTY